MKKNIKAIIAALSASIMCAVPVAASFAGTTAVTTITASAANTDPEVLSQPYGVSGNRGVALNAVVYEVNPSDGTAAVCGRYSHIRSIEAADRVSLNGRTYIVRSVKDDAFVTTMEGPYTVNKFKGGKNLTYVGARAFMGTLVYSAEFNGPYISFGDSAFKNANLREITIPECRVIGAHAFEGNYHLTSVYFTGSSSASITAGSMAFANCPSLARVHSNVWRNFYRKSDTFDPNCRANFSRLTMITEP